jgi:hypothetical protein
MIQIATFYASIDLVSRQSYYPLKNSLEENCFFFKLYFLKILFLKSFAPWVQV